MPSANMLPVTLKTTKGELIQLMVAPSCTVDQACNTLVHHYYFSPSVKLMFGSKILDGQRFLEEFPDGSLLIVGSAGPQGRDRSPQASKIRQTHHHAHPHTEASNRVDTEHHHTPTSRKMGSDRGTPAGAAAPQSPSSASTSSPSSASPQVEKLIIKAVIPATQKSVDIELLHGATLADLITAAIALDSRLIGAKVVFRGKMMTQPDKTLHCLGIRHGDAVHLATGTYTDLNILNLFRVREDFERVRAQTLQAGDTMSVTERKTLYEELMRVLFRTDELQDLEGEWRAERKELVKQITALQDSLRAH